MDKHTIVSIIKQIYDRLELTKWQIALAGVGVVLMVTAAVFKPDADMLGEYILYMILLTSYILFPGFWQYFVTRANRSGFTTGTDPNVYVPIAVGIVGYIIGSLWMFGM